MSIRARIIEGYEQDKSAQEIAQMFGRWVAAAMLAEIKSGAPLR